MPSSISHLVKASIMTGINFGQVAQEVEEEADPFSEEFWTCSKMMAKQWSFLDSCAFYARAIRDFTCDFNLTSLGIFWAT